MRTPYGSWLVCCLPFARPANTARFRFIDTAVRGGGGGRAGSQPSSSSSSSNEASIHVLEHKSIIIDRERSIESIFESTYLHILGTDIYELEVFRYKYMYRRRTFLVIRSFYYNYLLYRVLISPFGYSL